MSRRNSVIAFEGMPSEHIRSMYLPKKENNRSHERQATCAISTSIPDSCGGAVADVAMSSAGADEASTAASGGDDDDDDSGDPDGRLRSKPSSRALSNPPSSRHLHEHQKPVRVLRMKDLPDRCGLSRSALYQKILSGSFPRGFALSARAVGWLESDVESWISNRACETH